MLDIGIHFTMAWYDDARVAPSAKAAAAARCTFTTTPRNGALLLMGISATPIRHRRRYYSYRAHTRIATW